LLSFSPEAPSPRRRTPNATVYMHTRPWPSLLKLPARADPYILYIYIAPSPRPPSLAVPYASNSGSLHMQSSLPRAYSRSGSRFEGP
jgi:hypothetical protein